jgi:hypothetical protein
MGPLNLFIAGTTSSIRDEQNPWPVVGWFALSIIAFLKKSTFSLKYPGVLLPFKIIRKNSWKYLSKSYSIWDQYHFLWSAKYKKALTFFTVLILNRVSIMGPWKVSAIPWRYVPSWVLNSNLFATGLQYQIYTQLSYHFQEFLCSLKASLKDLYPPLYLLLALAI